MVENILKKIAMVGYFNSYLSGFLYPVFLSSGGPDPCLWFTLDLAQALGLPHVANKNTG